MKILLIYPYCLDERPQDDDVRPVPIGVYYIGALLREHGLQVEILNWFNINKTPGLIKKNLLKHRPDVIGFSILHANRWGGIEIARQAKKINPRVKIIFGGIGATFLWKELLSRYRSIDFIITGEGEYPFLTLIKKLQRQEEDEEGLEAIPGLAYRGQKKIILNAEADATADIDLLPNPAQYFTYQHVISSRGCPYNCTFCGSPWFWKRTVRFHSPAYFVKQLELLYRRGVSSFYVSDDTFTLKKERVLDICRLIVDKELPITWMAISRVNCIDEDILYWMRKAGCIQISYGVESGSQRIRDFLNKKIQTEDIKRAFALTRSYGILPRAYFIYGSPGETWETIQESVDLMQEIKPLDMASYILDIYPGTKLYALYQKKTGHGDDIWRRKVEDIMYFETDPDLSAEKVLAFGEKLRSEFYGNLHRYAESIELVDDRNLYREHADFCSRLGLTFSHGHFAGVEEVRHKGETATALFAKALHYCPDQRAYLGLAIIQQKNRDFSKAAATAAEGIRHFPASEGLRLCQAISYMNLGRFRPALATLEACRDSSAIAHYIKECRRQLEQEER